MTSGGATRPRVRPRLYRATGGRMVAGVAQGLAEHLRVPVLVVRLGFVLLALADGAGVAAYVAFWVLVPQQPGDDSDPTDERSQAGLQVGALLGLAALALGLVLVLQRAGVSPFGGVAVPFVVLGLGVAVLWTVADDAQRARWRASTGSGGRLSWLRVAAGLAAVVVGAAAVVASGAGARAAVQAVAAAVLVLAGVALVAGPYLADTLAELREERLERIRSQERADLAAHVHDSVLQTLTLIQRAAGDPREVVRLARSEERALRQWLYAPGDQDPTTLRAALQRAAAEVEEQIGVPVEVVVVGDTGVDERVGAVLLAAREAIVNAAKYAGSSGPVAVYAEVADDAVEVFVRDRGPGFALDDVPADRLGVRQSILGRTERAGGSAEVRSEAGRGTEVRLRVPLTKEPA